MREDPIVLEVRRIREELAAQFDFDVGSIFADIRKGQATLGSRLICRKKMRKPNKRLHLTGIPLRSVPAGELMRYVA